MAGQKAARSHFYSCGGLATTYVFLPVLSILAIDSSPPTEQLKNLLKAMDNEEKKVQKKVNKNKVKGVPVKNKKDW